MKLIKIMDDKELSKYSNLNDNFIYRKKGKNFIFLMNQNRNILNIHTETLKKELDYRNLRDYQKPILDFIFKNKKTCLSLPIRYGKTYISIISILNNFKNTLIFVDKNMLDKFYQILKFEYNVENVYIFHKDKNNNAFDLLSEHNCSIIITTEETFLSRYKSLSINSKNNLSLIKNVIVDEFHNFIKTADSRKTGFESIFKFHFQNLDLLIFLSATPTNENVFNLFFVFKLIDFNFIPTHWKSKYFKETITKYNGHNYECVDIESVKTIFESILYTNIQFNPFHTLIFNKIKIDNHPLIKREIEKSRIFIDKLKWSDDYRLINKTNNDIQFIPYKIRECIKLLSEHVDKKIVIICYFKEMQKNLASDLSNEKIHSKIINGSTIEKERKAIIDKFQNGNLNIIILQKDTAIGITLDKADLAICICNEYEPHKFYQALGRIVTTDLDNIDITKFKNVYWIVDTSYNSINILKNKRNIITNFGFNYNPIDEESCSLIMESKTDMRFISKFNLTGNIIPFDKNTLKINKNSILTFIATIKNKYLFIVDNDQIINDLHLINKDINYITYNKLLNATNDFKNIEEILFSKGIYKQNDLDYIELFSEKNDWFNSIKTQIVHEYNHEKMIELIQNYQINPRNPNLDAIIIKYIHSQNWENHADSKIRKIKNVIKSHLMDNIENDFFAKNSVNIQNIINSHKNTKN